MSGCALTYIGYVALLFADKIDSFFAAFFCFQQCLVRLLEKLLYILAVTREAR